VNWKPWLKHQQKLQSVHLKVADACIFFVCLKYGFCRTHGAANYSLETLVTRCSCWQMGSCHSHWVITVFPFSSVKNHAFKLCYQQTSVGIVNLLSW